MTKDSVLAILKKADGYVSGERISDALGISRMAVNAAVKTLRGEGYEILSSTNRGYRLSGGPDRVNGGELLALLPEERVAKVQCLELVDSTNKRLREMAVEGAPDGQVVIANEQTQGRGRMGRSFSSQKDRGIYLSILLRPQGSPADSVTLTAWTAVAVSRAIERVCGLHPGIKWVNDLFLGSRKLCGILTEMSVEGESGHIQYVIIGIGVNVNQETGDFSQELQSVATSLRAETGQVFSRARLAAEIIREMDRLWDDWPHQKSEYLEAYRAHNVTVGREARVIRGDAQSWVEVLAVNEDFSLKIRHKDGTIENLSSGEVSVKF